MTTLPTWALYVIAFGSPGLTFVGVGFTVLFNRKGTREQRLGALELETRSKREELMRSLRWASELAVSEDARKAKLGVAQLHALGESSLLDSDEQLFVDAALEAVVRDAVLEIENTGEDAEVVQVEDADAVEHGRERTGG